MGVYKNKMCFHSFLSHYVTGKHLITISAINFPSLLWQETVKTHLIFVYSRHILEQLIIRYPIRYFFRPNRIRSGLSQVRPTKDPISDRIKDFSVRSDRSTEILGLDTGRIPVQSARFPSLLQLRLKIQFFLWRPKFEFFHICTNIGLSTGSV